MSQLPLLPPSTFFTERDCPGVSFSSTEMKAIPSLLTMVVSSSTATSPPLEGVGTGAGGSVAGGAPTGGSVAGGAPTGGAVGGAPTGGAVGGAPTTGGIVAGAGG